LSLGETIKSDLAIKGNRLYSDAAWKTKEATETHENIHTGLGIFGQIQHDQLNATILVQASTSRTPSPLQAEAIALSL
jgi:hypothetical protein